ncbi:MAG: catalase family protein [Candidatus Electrothrix sp. GW3-4]|uniref:catalase family protein n=1 Tax=Candidatus Electrothrix sp. GW3-4 TaxID=3126740 RepID=UPI0030D4EDDB
MNPELQPDFSLPGEEDIFQEMIKLTIGMMEESQEGCPLRVQHAKANACLTATFEIASDIPTDLQYGVFSQSGRTFEAIVRFSTAQGKIQPDNEPTARGLAIKLLDVAGPRAMDGDTDQSQDFLMVDHPVFPFPNAKEYRDVIKHKSVPLIGDLLAFAHLQLFDHDQLDIIKEIRKKTVTSPLNITYWSGSPYWLGDAAGTTGQAVKYSAVPPRLLAGPDDPAKLPDNYLREAIAKQLAKDEVVFDFKVQRQGDPTKMPIEDASASWDEQDSVPVTVATLRLSKQVVSPESALEKRCEDMSFNPWHALKEHRPLGGINRLRKAVYEASFTEREHRKKTA